MQADINDCSTYPTLRHSHFLRPVNSALAFAKFHLCVLYPCFSLIYLCVIGAVAFAAAFVTPEIELVRRKQGDLRRRVQ
jgi:hypothetical protein